VSHKLEVEEHRSFAFYSGALTTVSVNKYLTRSTVCSAQSQYYCSARVTGVSTYIHSDNGSRFTRSAGHFSSRKHTLITASKYDTLSTDVNINEPFKVQAVQSANSVRDTIEL